MEKRLERHVGLRSGLVALAPAFAFCGKDKPVEVDKQGVGEKDYFVKGVSGEDSGIYVTAPRDPEYSLGDRFENIGNGRQLLIFWGKNDSR